jgi:hypothetical protein
MIQMDNRLWAGTYPKRLTNDCSYVTVTFQFCSLNERGNSMHINLPQRTPHPQWQSRVVFVVVRR